MHNHKNYQLYPRRHLAYPQNNRGGGSVCTKYPLKRDMVLGLVVFFAEAVEKLPRLAYSNGNRVYQVKLT